MKKLFAALLALVSSVAFATTTVPVQLLNPTGSISGQAIVSTGASSAPAWGNVGLSGLASIAANTVVANATGSSAAPTAFAMPSCSATANVLQYTSGTGFTCLTTLFSSPTITTPTITGVTSGTCASAGNVGECAINNASAVLITTSATAQNCTSTSLTAGDWMVFGYIQYAQGSGGSVSFTQITSSLSTTTATQGSVTTALGLAFTANFTQSLEVPMILLTVTTTTTVYLVGQATYASGAPTMTCKLNAVRFH